MNARELERAEKRLRACSRSPVTVKRNGSRLTFEFGGPNDVFVYSDKELGILGGNGNVPCGVSRVLSQLIPEALGESPRRKKRPFASKLNPSFNRASRLKIRDLVKLVRATYEGPQNS